MKKWESGAAQPKTCIARITGTCNDLPAGRVPTALPAGLKETRPVGVR